MNANDKPNYVLKTKEKIRVSKNPKIAKYKKVILIILIVLIVASFVFGENLFGELSFMAQILLIGLVFGVFLSDKKEFAEFPFELHFYDDRIEIYRLEVHYSNGKIKKEFYIFKYADNPIFTYNKKSNFMIIKGIAHGEWYLYTKEKELSKNPERVRDNIEGICYFYPSSDIIKEIENNSPCKVKIEDILI